MKQPKWKFLFPKLWFLRIKVLNLGKYQYQYFSSKIIQMTRESAWLSQEIVVIILATSTRSVFLSEQDKLQLVITSKHTSTCNSTQYVCTSTFEEWLGTLICDDCLECMQRALVLHSLSRSHHHPSTNSVNGVRSQTSTNCDSPSQKETSKETILLTRRYRGK